jgi:hypothetical protein
MGTYWYEAEILLNSMSPRDGHDADGTATFSLSSSAGLSASKFRSRAIAPREVSSIVHPEMKEARLWLKPDNVRSSIGCSLE